MNIKEVDLEELHLCLQVLGKLAYSNLLLTKYKKSLAGERKYEFSTFDRVHLDGYYAKIAAELTIIVYVDIERIRVAVFGTSSGKDGFIVDKPKFDVMKWINEDIIYKF